MENKLAHNAWVGSEGERRTKVAKKTSARRHKPLRHGSILFFLFLSFFASNQFFRYSVGLPVTVVSSKR